MNGKECKRNDNRCGHYYICMMWDEMCDNCRPSELYMDAVDGSRMKKNEGEE